MRGADSTPGGSALDEAEAAAAAAAAAQADADAAQAAADSKLASFKGRTTPAAVPAPGDYTASQVSASGPLGATQVQAAIDNIPPAYVATAATGPTVAGTGLVTYFTTTTPSLAAGTYIVEWNVVNSHTAASSNAGVQVTIGAAQVPTATIDGGLAPSAGSRTSTSARGTYVHAAPGTLAVLVQVRRSAGTGNIIPQSLTLTLRRIA